MDIRMPGIDGIEATRRVAAASVEGPRALMLTTFDLDERVPGDPRGRERLPAQGREPDELVPPCAWSPPPTRCSRRPSPGG